jgi:hypothetical protein
MENIMFEIWEGDLFLFTVDFESEADLYREQGYTVKAIANA